jgi:hypothetical protein
MGVCAIQQEKLDENFAVRGVVGGERETRCFVFFAHANVGIHALDIQEQVRENDGVGALASAGGNEGGVLAALIGDFVEKFWMLIDIGAGVEKQLTEA